MTAIVTVHPDVVLKSLLDKGCRSDKEAKLRKVHELCLIEYKRNSQGARDLSIAHMSRVAENHGLFKARTIYNKPSEDYATLINAWSAYNGPKESKLVKDQLTPAGKHDFLKVIEDPALRTLCQIAFNERDKLRAELNMVKAKVKVVVDMRPTGVEIRNEIEGTAVSRPLVHLTDSERSALASALDPKALDRQRWRIGSTGEILDSRGRFVFSPGFATAIEKILDGCPSK